MDYLLAANLVLLLLRCLKRAMLLWLRLLGPQDGAYGVTVGISLNEKCCVFLCLQRSKRSFDNFDPEFTDEAARLTPCDKSFIANINQNDFHGFSFVNAEFPSREKNVPTGGGDISV